MTVTLGLPLMVILLDGDAVVDGLVDALLVKVLVLVSEGVIVLVMV